MPRRFSEPGKVLRLKKNLCGKKAAPRLWFQHLKERLEACGFKQMIDVDPCLFISDKVICLVYVDDALLFADDDTGVITKLNEALDGLLDGPTNSAGETLDSLFTGRRKALDTIIDSIDDQIERLESNLERFEESLVQRFANLESVIGGLNSQSAFLAQNLAATNS